MTEPTEKRQRGKGKPWPKGVSGNPKGRPPGVANKATMAAQALLDGEAKALTRKAIEKALEGDTVALRLCLERLVPVKKERPLSLALPKIEGAADLPGALAAVMGAVAAGELTPGEGQTITAMLEAYRKGLELADIEARVTALEKRGGQCNLKNRIERLECGARRVVIIAREGNPPEIPEPIEHDNPDDVVILAYLGVRPPEDKDGFITVQTPEGTITVNMGEDPGNGPVSNVAY